MGTLSKLKEGREIGGGPGGKEVHTVMGGETYNLLKNTISKVETHPKPENLREVGI